MQSEDSEPPLLDVRGLSLEGGTPAAPVALLHDVWLQVRRGEVLGLVGESGSGKSLTALALMGLLPAGKRGGVRRTAGSMQLEGLALDGLDESAWRTVRARRVAMVFQEPMTALNPTRRVRAQMGDVLAAHRQQMPAAQRERVMKDCLSAMGIGDSSRVLQSCPFQLSGGLRQRVLIAMALLCNPDLLIADEITTALDVTVQAQVLGLLLGAARDRGLAVLMISHDLALVRHTCARVAVMLGGRIIEGGSTDEVIEQPRHPYTRALIDSLPERGTPRTPLLADRRDAPAGATGGCAFAPRCPRADPACSAWPALSDEPHGVRCWHPLEGRA